MKNTLLLLLASLMMTSCYKEDISDKNPSSGTSNYGGTGGPNGSGGSGSGSGGSGSSTGSHYCGYPTKAGAPCKRQVSGYTGYCWQHK